MEDLVFVRLVMVDKAEMIEVTSFHEDFLMVIGIQFALPAVLLFL